LKRIVEFLRSVIPADPFQLLFLAGVVCLVVAHGLRWRPVELSLLSGQLTESFVRQVQIFGPFFVFPIIFAGAAGYFICFWPGTHPVRRILALVFLPTLASLGLWFSLFVYLNEPFSSVLESTGNAVNNQINGAQGMLWKLPQAFQFSSIGLLLIGIFTSRLAFGIATLPLALPERPALQSEDCGSWRRLQILLWFLVSLPFFTSASLSFVTIGIPFLRTSRLPSYVQSAWFGRVASIAEVGVVFGIALCIMGREGRQTVRSTIRLPGLRWSLLALAFPACIDLLISTGQYLVARAHWAAHDFGRLEAPQFGSYFDVPSIWFLLLFFAALFEEVIFRGVLQTRLIHRYGLYRGIFLVGVVWAAFHFFSDFSFSHFTDSAVFLTLGLRIFMCVALSFVLAWLTLRSGSVVPAAIAHTVYNILVFSAFGLPFAGKGTLRIALWALLAYILFRYCTVPEEAKIETVTVTASSEPTV
jgi:membrane protease YdiL (CAAX protease family)